MEKQRIKKVCPYGCAFEVSPSGINRKYCSKKCHNFSKEGKHPWNYGLTNQVDKRIALQHQKAKITRHKNGWFKNLEATSLKMSKSRKGKVRGPFSIQWKNNLKIAHKNSKKTYFKISSQELAVRKLLDIVGIGYTSQHRIDLQSTIHPYTDVDIFIPSWSLCIFIDGIYWHSLPGYAERDTFTTSKLEEFGYRVLRLSDVEVNKSLDECQEKILSFKND